MVSWPTQDWFIGQRWRFTYAATPVERSNSRHRAQTSPLSSWSVVYNKESFGLCYLVKDCCLRLRLNDLDKVVCNRVWCCRRGGRSESGCWGELIPIDPGFSFNNDRVPYLWTGRLSLHELPEPFRLMWPAAWRIFATGEIVFSPLDDAIWLNICSSMTEELTSRDWLSRSLLPWNCDKCSISELMLLVSCFNTLRVIFFYANTRSMFWVSSFMRWCFLTRDGILTGVLPLRLVCCSRGVSLLDVWELLEWTGGLSFGRLPELSPAS